MSIRYPIPQVPKEFLEYLDAVFPMEAFLSADSLDELRMLQGNRVVVDMIRVVHTSQAAGKTPYYTKKES